MTWPTILHLTDGIPGDGFDGWQNYWNLWWVKQAILIKGTNPFFTDYLYPPTGVSLLFHTLNIFNGLWTLPIQLTFGLAPAYHSIVFLSFTLAGYGGYLLSLYTLVRLFPAGRGLRLAAFVGGLVFTMSPFHLAHLLGHMQVFSMIWPPFYILWLLRTLEPWSASNNPPPRQWRNAAISTLFLILATLVDWYHTLYLLIFTGLVLLWTMWQQGRALSEQGHKGAGGQGSRGAGEKVSRSSAESGPVSPAEASTPKARITHTCTARRRKCHASRITHHALRHQFLRPLWVVLAIGLEFGLVTSPLLVPMVRNASAKPDLETGLWQNITLSADLLAFITPSEMHPLWGEWAKSIADNFSAPPSERLIFAGFVPLALATFILIRGWRKRIVRFWALITGTFFVIALGPYLHIGGQIVAIGSWQIPMPYLLLYHTVPFINLTRSLSRYDLMIMLGLGILVAIALVQLPITNTQRARCYQLPITKSRITHHVSRFTLPFFAALLICFEFLPVPYPVSKIDTPQFYFDIGAQAEDYTIAELPMNWDRPTPLLHQTTHGKRLLTAYTSRNNALELAWRTPVLQHWRYLGPDIIDQPLAQIAPTIFFDFNLRYIVLDFWQMPPGPERAGTERWVAAALPGVVPIYDDGRLKVYQSPPKGDTQPYLSLGQGWGERQDFGDGLITRTFSADQEPQPELFLHHPPQNQTLTLEITAATNQNTAQSLTIFAGAEPVGNLQVRQTFLTDTILLPPLDDSPVKLRFTASNPSGTISVSRIGLRMDE
jgi:hypothetical protein